MPTSKMPVSEQVQREFTRSVCLYNGKLYQAVVEIGKGQGVDILARDGTLKSGIFKKRKARVGEPLPTNSYLHLGTPFMTETFERPGVKELFLASRVEYLGEGHFRAVLQTNDESFTQRLSQLNWQQVDRPALPVDEDGKKSKKDSKPAPPAPDKPHDKPSDKEGPRPPKEVTFNDLSDLVEAKFVEMLAGFKGQAYGCFGYTGELSQNGRLVSCVYTKPVGIYVAEIPGNLSDQTIPDGTSIRAEVYVKPDKPGKYLAAMFAAKEGGGYLAYLETNDKSRARGLDFWEKVKHGGERREKNKK